ncbi:ogr/Delta-like zinc finger family protein [Azotobacter vinelandii]|nr:ogr/Delta-like zinc finger family protein [Azotobacter vinelandii]SFX99352.1 Ogr/Delta-like zinc finger [Azotobacter vinelandii]
MHRLPGNLGGPRALKKGNFRVAAVTPPVEVSAGPRSPRNWLCPDCYGRLIRRTSKQESSLVRKITYHCKNPECGSKFLGREKIDYRLAGPGIPEMRVPRSPRNGLCPHCSSPVRKRAIEWKSLWFRTITYQCQAFGCGASFLGHEEIIERLSGPFVANPISELMRWPGYEHLEWTKPGEVPTKGICPRCKSPLVATCMPTKDPLLWSLHVECTYSRCRWRASGPVAVAEEDAESQAHKGGPVRVNFEIDQAAHAKLKANAAKQGKTIRALLTAYAKSLLADKKA